VLAGGVLVYNATCRCQQAVSTAPAQQQCQVNSLLNLAAISCRHGDTVAITLTCKCLAGAGAAVVATLCKGCGHCLGGGHGTRAVAGQILMQLLGVVHSSGNTLWVLGRRGCGLWLGGRLGQALQGVRKATMLAVTGSLQQAPSALWCRMYTYAQLVSSGSKAALPRVLNAHTKTGSSCYLLNALTF
jgi:hypothetical protein